MFGGIDYSNLVAGMIDPEEVKRQVLPRIYELLLAGGLESFETTLFYPDGTVEIQMRGHKDQVSIFVVNGHVLTKENMGGVLPKEEDADEMLFCCNPNKDTGCKRGCGCGCLLDNGFIEWKRETEIPHRGCV